MKWYNVEIPYNTRNTIERANEFKTWLHEHDYKFECSAVEQGNMIHFEIYASSSDLPEINNALDNIVWFDAITTA